MISIKEPTLDYLQSLTAPWRTCKNHTVPSKVFKFVTKEIMVIPFIPRDSVEYTVDFCVMLRARQDFRIFLNCQNSFPSTRHCKCNRIASHPCKTVDEDSFVNGNCIRNMFGYLARDWLTKSLVLLDFGAYLATGSGVTPNHESSVIHTPSSYLENMSWRW